MATVLCLAALCWLTGPAVQGAFLQSRRSDEYPDTWNTAVVPVWAVYVVGATLDARNTASRESRMNVTANGHRIFLLSAARGTTNSAAVAINLRINAIITAELLGNAPSAAKNSLTVTYIDTITPFVYLTLGVSLRRFNYRSNVIFQKKNGFRMLRRDY